MKREFVDKIDVQELRKANIETQGMSLVGVINRDSRRTAIVLESFGTVRLVGSNDITFLLFNGDEYLMLSVKGNDPSKKLDYKYEYKRDLYNVYMYALKKIPVSEKSFLDNIVTALWFDYDLNIESIGVVNIQDTFKYEEEEKNIDLSINVDVGLVFHEVSGARVLVYMDDFSFLNVKVYSNEIDFDNDISGSMNELFGGKLKEIKHE